MANGAFGGTLSSRARGVWVAVADCGSRALRERRQFGASDKASDSLATINSAATCLQLTCMGQVQRPALNRQIPSLQRVRRTRVL